MMRVLVITKVSNGLAVSGDVDGPLEQFDVGTRHYLCCDAIPVREAVVIAVGSHGYLGNPRLDVLISPGMFPEPVAVDAGRVTLTPIEGVAPLYGLKTPPR